MSDLLRTRLREDANHLQATGSHAHREIAKRLHELLDATAKPIHFESLGVDCTAELLRLRKVEEAARAVDGMWDSGHQVVMQRVRHKDGLVDLSPCFDRLREALGQ